VIAYTAKQYQVDTAIIVATLGVETLYGQNTENFSVLQSTLYPVFLRTTMTREHHIDPQYIKGSYAGAIGPAQFMPSSLIQYSHGKHLYHGE